MFLLNQDSVSAQPLRTALLTNLLYMVVLPIVIYHFASAYMPAVAALGVSAIPPALRMVYGLLKHGRLNVFGGLALISIAVKLLSVLIFQDSRLVLIGDSLMTGVHGVLFLGSLLFGKPLLLILAQNMLETTPSASTEQLSNRWREPRVRAFFTFITALVGTGLLIELIVSIVLAFTLSVEQFLVIKPVIHYGLLGLILLIVVLLVRYRRNQSKTSENIPQQ